MTEETSINTKGKVSYCGLEISQFLLPQKLSQFLTEFIEQFGLTNQIKPSEISSIQYKEKEIKDESSYTAMLKEIVSSKGKETIFVKTEKVPLHFKGEKSIDFEEEIKKLVEREFKVAANNIKEGLTNHLSLSNCKKVRIEQCSSCNQQIIGYLYKKVSCDKDENYCELCSTKIEQPMFKIY